MDAGSSSMDSRSRPVFDGDDTLWNEYRYEVEAWLSVRGYGNGLTLNDQGDGGKWTGPEKTKQPRETSRNLENPWEMLRNLETSKPRNLEASKPRNRNFEKPRNLETSKRRNNGTTRHRNT